MNAPFSRRGVRAAGKTQTTISVTASTLARARAVAKSQRRSLSNLLEIWLDEKLADYAATQKTEKP